MRSWISRIENSLISPLSFCWCWLVTWVKEKLARARITVDMMEALESRRLLTITPHDPASMTLTATTYAGVSHIVDFSWDSVGDAYEYRLYSAGGLLYEGPATSFHQSNVPGGTDPGETGTAIT